MTAGAELRRGLLAARERRQRELDRLARTRETVVAVSLAIPGETKDPPDADALFRWGLAEICRLVPPLGPPRFGYDGLGPFAFYRTAAAPTDAKRRAVTVETAIPPARLLDIDVYAPGGIPVDRTALRLPQRTCLVCPAPARECIRRRRHDQLRLTDAAFYLLAAFAG